MAFGPVMGRLLGAPTYISMNYETIRGRRAIIRHEEDPLLFYARYVAGNEKYT